MDLQLKSFTGKMLHTPPPRCSCLLPQETKKLSIQRPLVKHLCEDKNLTLKDAWNRYIVTYSVVIVFRIPTYESRLQASGSGLIY